MVDFVRKALSRSPLLVIFVKSAQFCHIVGWIKKAILWYRIPLSEDSLPHFQKLQSTLGNEIRHARNIEKKKIQLDLEMIKMEVNPESLSKDPEIRLSRPLFKPSLFQMLSGLWKFKSLRSRKLMKLKLVEKSYYPNISNLNGTFCSFQGQRIKGSVDLHDYLEELKKERNLSLPKDFFFFSDEI